ncbi:hypothetical protein Y032_0643g1056 [Ancylostoma ceylanicum]|uniref:Uncharacterized protein n=1 Tax=Ancylostoma ceylanicum TaxID=53326 RepID=A0A016WJD8_9BILA|nr:hypothetical protein Y032_0643g1056 [Ancylostoma ceylanicum]
MRFFVGIDLDLDWSSHLFQNSFSFVNSGNTGKRCQKPISSTKQLRKGAVSTSLDRFTSHRSHNSAQPARKGRAKGFQKTGILKVLTIFSTVTVISARDYPPIVPKSRAPKFLWVLPLSTRSPHIFFLAYNE